MKKKFERSYNGKRLMFVLVVLAFIGAALLNARRIVPATFNSVFPLKAQISWSPAQAPAEITLKQQTLSQTFMASSSPWSSKELRNFDIIIEPASPRVLITTKLPPGTKITQFACRIWQQTATRSWREYTAEGVKTTTNDNMGVCAYH